MHLSKSLTFFLQECLSKMDLVDHSVLGATVKQQEQNNVSKFLNRILGLTVEKQNLVSLRMELILILTGYVR